jgi:hypothetical protein
MKMDEGLLDSATCRNPDNVIRRDPLVRALVEREAFVQAFSPDSTLEPRLKAFHRRGPKCSL